MKNITINFGDILSELESKSLVMCNRKTSIGLFLLDEQSNLYTMENRYLGSYLDKLIRNKTIVEFKLVDSSLRDNIKDWELEILDCKQQFICW